jgi:hypothetical protein
MDWFAMNKKLAIQDASYEASQLDNSGRWNVERQIFVLVLWDYYLVWIMYVRFILSSYITL